MVQKETITITIQQTLTTSFKIEKVETTKNTTTPIVVVLIVGKSRDNS